MRSLGDLAGRDHHPDDPGRLELRCQLLERRRGRLDLRVVGHDLVPVPTEALRHAGAHSPEADHSELHSVLQSHTADISAAFLERLEVAGGLSRDQRPEAEVAARDVELLAEVVDDLDREHRVRAAFVQLSRRVQVARAEAFRDDAAGLASPLDEWVELPLPLGIDEGENCHVLRGFCPVEQFLDRPFRTWPGDCPRAGSKRGWRRCGPSRPGRPAG